METKKITKLNKLASAGLLVCALFAFAPSVQAQDDDMQARVGIKGGINLSNLFIDDVNDQKAKWGLHGGLFVKIPVAKFFAVQPELLYTNAGNKVGNYSALSGPQDQVNFNLNYIQLPILASLTAGPVSIQAGPYVSYLVGANVKNVKVDQNGIPTDTSGGRELNKSDFNTIDYGLAGGLALDIKGFQLGLRYNYGLTNVGKKNISGLLTNGSQNSVAQLYIAFGL